MQAKYKKRKCIIITIYRETTEMWIEFIIGTSILPNIVNLNIESFQINVQ